jgi:twitching motility protein PilT
VPAVEVMLSTGRIREMIMEKSTSRAITEQISQGVDSYGMQTFDQSLMFLLQNGLITYEEALAQSSNPDDFTLRVSGVASAQNNTAWSNFERSPAGGSPGSAGAPPAKSGGEDFNLDEFEIERF